jgi:hypothetical protein
VWFLGPSLRGLFVSRSKRIIIAIATLVIIAVLATGWYVYRTLPPSTSAISFGLFTNRVDGEEVQTWYFSISASYGTSMQRDVYLRQVGTSFNRVVWVNWTFTEKQVNIPHYIVWWNYRDVWPSGVCEAWNTTEVVTISIKVSEQCNWSFGLKLSVYDNL